jgi:hypothetical protein
MNAHYGLAAELGLAAEFSAGLIELCARERLDEAQVKDMAHAAFPDRPLIEAMYSYLMQYSRDAATEAGHKAAGHGRV